MKPAAALIALYRPGARAGWADIPASGKRHWWVAGLVISGALFVFGLTQLFEDKCGAGAACACTPAQPSAAAAVAATPTTILRARTCAPVRRNELADAP